MLVRISHIKTNIISRLAIAVAAGWAVLGLAAAGESPEPPGRLPQTGQWAFHFLPKAFQTKPDLEMTVITEFTPVGRLMRPVTPLQPAYYIAQAGGLKQLGDVMGGEHSPLPADLERSMVRALAVNGFLAADPPAHQPTLAVFYTWGSHNKLSPEMAAQFPELAARHRLERAMLVGGKEFTANVGRMLEFGETILDHSERMDYLNDQANDDLYFVVASAYDYRALAAGHRTLLWRTNMTVNARGVSMQETLLPLIAAAAPHLGREMTAPDIEMRQISREGVVEVGTPTVVEDSPAAPRGAAPPPTKK